jgi:RND family efflux transporter MFP subunit
MGVEFVTLQSAALERTTEYLATLKSRRSTTLQPMVEGPVTQIAVRSGARVQAGDLLLEIDDSRQRATVASLESTRTARAADLAYARREAVRKQELFEAGAASAQELEQAQAELETAEAQLRAAEEQIREQRVQLDYYRVVAPTSGIVGDVPVRVGDRVNPTTTLTTIDTGGGLELYLYVPVKDAALLRPGLAVRIVDDSGVPITSATIDFVSPQVDEGTQTVLAKAPLPEAGSFRTEQQVRVRMIWREEPTVTVPVVAVRRVNGVHFVFLLEEAEGRSVARERSVRVGPIVGNDYVVLDGLTAGDRLIVSGTQKIRDGAPVDPKPQPPVARG